jgi:hypothetical protein
MIDRNEITISAGSKSQSSALPRPPVKSQHGLPAMPNFTRIYRTTASLRNGRSHHLSETALIFRIQRDDTRLGGANHRFAGIQDTFTGFFLESFDDEQEEEAALKKLNAKKVRHEADVRVKAEDLLDGVGSLEGVGDGRCKGGRGGPEIFVFNK